MPISCPLDLKPLTSDEFAELDYAVMKHAFSTHNELGGLADEQIYQTDFSERLNAAGFDSKREVPIMVSFRGFQKRYFIDLVVGACAIYELKTVNALLPEHTAQLLNYLLLLDQRHGKLVNFGTTWVGSKFVNAPMDIETRRSFSIIDTHWSGPATLRELVVEMLRDWGTGLELPLYRQAITHLLGGEEKVAQPKPLIRSGILLGKQRFYMADGDSAFRVTAFERPSSRYAEQLQRLIQFSPLKSMHWINIGRKTATFSTID